MPTVKGQAETKRFFRQLPEQIERRLLRGAARAGIDVVADEAADRVTSDAVREGFQKRVTGKDGVVTATLSLKPGWARSLGTWLEYGTAPHVISVDPDLSGGRTARRLNTLAKQGVLTIGDRPVGATVYHPGARPHPFMRVSLDVKEREAVDAAQRYINAKVRRLGVAGGGAGAGADGGDDA